MQLYLFKQNHIKRENKMCHYTFNWCSYFPAVWTAAAEVMQLCLNKRDGRPVS